MLHSKCRDAQNGQGKTRSNMQKKEENALKHNWTREACSRKIKKPGTRLVRTNSVLDKADADSVSSFFLAVFIFLLEVETIARSKTGSQMFCQHQNM